MSIHTQLWTTRLGARGPGDVSARSREKDLSSDQDLQLSPIMEIISIQPTLLQLTVARCAHLRYTPASHEDQYTSTRVPYWNLTPWGFYASRMGMDYMCPSSAAGPLRGHRADDLKRLDLTELQWRYDKDLEVVSI